MAQTNLTSQRLMPRASMIWLSYAFITLVALLLRTLNLGVFLNGDEALFWIQRAGTFVQAVANGDFAATAISTHPGVTTMWLGGAGLALSDIAFDLGLVQDHSFATWLALVRLPMVLVHTLGVVLGYALLRRLFSPLTAFLAALLWAADPFVVAYQRMIHVDGLASTFIALSLLAACLYWYADPRRRWLIVSAICAGLAILSKSPAVLLGPVVALVALTGGTAAEERAWPRRILLAVRPLLSWGLICLLTVVALWPALWVGPLAAYAQMRLGVDEGNSPHVSGNFFMGRETDVPGPLFYPVALALRLTPWTLLGIVLLPWAMRHIKQRSEQRSLTALTLMVVLFTLAMSVFEKKLNRYLIPIFPLLDILAALGLMGLAGFVQQRLRAAWVTRAIAPGLVACVTLLALANGLYWHPYGIMAYNQLLGGARAGFETFLTGSGEGLNEAADWLNQQPDITGVRVASSVVPALQPYLVSGAQAIAPDGETLPPKTGYVVVYIRNLQRAQMPAPFDQFYGKETPLHVVMIHGLEYALIYQVPPAVAVERTASFGDQLQLRGFEQLTAPIAGQPLQFRLSWKQDAPPGDRMLFVHLLAADGQIVAQADLPLMLSGTGYYPQSELTLPLPADLPAGQYRIFIGLYDPATGQRYPLQTDAPSDASDGTDALLLTDITLP